jgi:hypothetical protein
MFYLQRSFSYYYDKFYSPCRMLYICAYRVPLSKQATVTPRITPCTKISSSNFTVKRFYRKSNVADPDIVDPDIMDLHIIFFYSWIRIRLRNADQETEKITAES